jgi:hypothetical protein
MAGSALTNRFMLGTATVMIGAPSKLYDLKPSSDSVGLVKNFSMASAPSYTELTQGVKNNLVFSVLTKNDVTCSMEVFEYTSKNLTFGLGLDGSSVTAPSVSTTTTGAVVGDGTIVVIPVTSATGLAAGDNIMLENNTDDDVHVRKILSIAGLNVTVTRAIGTGVTIASGATVRKINRVDVGSLADQPFLAAKVVGKLADGTNCVLLLPKIRITKGFTLAFSSDNFGNLPFEFSIYDLVTTDPFYTDFAGIGRAAVMTAS